VDGCGDAGSLAWWPANDDLSSFCVRCKSPHVVMHRDAREATAEEGAPAFIDLDELHGTEPAGGMESEGVSADAGEQVGDS
jgi:hypothetical protein